MKSVHGETQSHKTGKTPETAATRHACLLLISAAFLWGSGNLANKTILDDLDPVGAVFLRSVIAALALSWPALNERMPPGWLRSVAPGSLMFALALITQQWGYQTATVTNASFLVNASCVLTPVLGVLFWRDPPQVRTFAAAALVLAGALLMSGAWLSLTSVNEGDVLCLLSSLFYSFWIILIGRHLQRYSTPAATTLAQCLAAALLSAAFLSTDDPAFARDWWAALPEGLYLGLFSTAAAFALTASAQTRVSASTAAIIVSAESVFGAAAGILFLAERPGAFAMVGAGLILTAILVMAQRPEALPARLCPKAARADLAHAYLKDDVP